MAQVIDILNGAALALGSLSPGQSLNASESQDFLSRLQDMQDSLSTERENLFVVGNQQLTPPASKASYQIGPSATDFNQPRPLLIQTASHIYNGITEDIELVDSVNFASIRDKAATSKVITKLYCDYNAPIATLYVWPVPVLAPVIELYTQTPLPTWSTIFDTVNLPDGYLKMLKFNLALNIAGDLGTPANILAMIQPVAIDSLAAVRALNQQFLGSYLGGQSRGKQPNVGVPQTSGVNVAAGPLGSPVQMVPPQQ
jgi:hypothetical protein